MVTNNKLQLVFSHYNSILGIRQTSVKFIHPIIAQFASSHENLTLCYRLL